MDPFVPLAAVGLPVVRLILSIVHFSFFPLLKDHADLSGVARGRQADQVGCLQVSRCAYRWTAELAAAAYAAAAAAAGGH